MYHVEVTKKQGDVFEIRTGEKRSVIESLSENLSPGEALLTSLGSCMGFFARSYLEHAGINPVEFALKLEAEFSKDPPVRFKQIMVTLDLLGADLDQARKDSLIKFLKNCPIHNTLKMNPDIKVELK